MPKKVLLLTPDESRAWLEEHGVTQAAVAEKCGVTKYTIRDLLKGNLKGKRGKSHIAAVALRLKAPAQGESPLDLIPTKRHTRRPATASGAEQGAQ